MLRQFLLLILVLALSNASKRRLLQQTYPPIPQVPVDIQNRLPPPPTAPRLHWTTPNPNNQILINPPASIIPQTIPQIFLTPVPTPPAIVPNQHHPHFSLNPQVPVMPQPQTQPQPQVPYPYPQVWWTQPPLYIPPPTPPPTTTTTKPPLPGHQFGAYGQNCPIPLGLEQCINPTDYVSDQTGNNHGGHTTCGMASDCCMCQSVSCGSPGSHDCEALLLSGDASAFGVQDITVYSEPALDGGVSCMGMKSCAESKINAYYVARMDCTGRFGCQGADIVIHDPAPDFRLECGVTGACENANIFLNFTGPPSGNVCDPSNAVDFFIGGIECIGVGGCNNATITILNNGCDTVIVQNLECRSGSCDGTTFNFYGKSPIGIQSCQIPSGGVAPTGIDRCFMNLQELNCLDSMSCANQDRTFTDPLNGFLIKCESELSCSGSNFVIDLTTAIDPNNPPVSLMISCGSVRSCNGLNVEVRNANVRTSFMPVLEITCGAQGSCDGLTVTTVESVLPSISCSEVTQCNHCTYNGMNCGGFQPIVTMAPYVPNPVPQPGNPLPQLQQPWAPAPAPQPQYPQTQPQPWIPAPSPQGPQQQQWVPAPSPQLPWAVNTPAPLMQPIFPQQQKWVPAPVPAGQGKPVTPAPVDPWWVNYPGFKPNWNTNPSPPPVTNGQGPVFVFNP